MASRFGFVAVNVCRQLATWCHHLQYGHQLHRDEWKLADGHAFVHDDQPPTAPIWCDLFWSCYQLLREEWSMATRFTFGGNWVGLVDLWVFSKGKMCPKEKHQSLVNQTWQLNGLRPCFNYKSFELSAYFGLTFSFLVSSNECSSHRLSIITHGFTKEQLLTTGPQRPHTATSIALNAAISACSTAGRWQEALQLLEITNADVVSYSASITGCVTWRLEKHLWPWWCIDGVHHLP